MTTLRLILGDQLNPAHSWFVKTDKDVIFLMAEMKQEATYVTHHIQKLTAFFMAMRRFGEHLKNQGHRLHYLKIGDPANPHHLDTLIRQTVAAFRIEKFEYQLPDEYRLDQQLRAICESLEIESNATDTEHFLTKRHDLEAFFNGKKQMIMEQFYRMMRKENDILIDTDGSPEGGKWNYDKSNRKSWNGTPPPPAGPVFNHNITPVLKEIEKAGIESMGSITAETFNWPLDREQALAQLDHFCEHLLPYFGDYQDAMHTDGGQLFHSLLSFPLNTKIISPKEVIQKVVKAYKASQGGIHISQAEGYIRQVIGWREYMRGIYWKEMPGYRSKNFFKNTNTLPSFFWTGKTGMNCLKHCIQGSLKNAYAHHIQRLMVTGNFALLCQVHPDETDRWYLGVYIDAIEWVEITNTRGMSQYADGGLLATKPYIASANYINKMSNYCRGCKYEPKKRTGKDACPFNTLYWNFLDEKRKHLKTNRRMGMMYHLLDKIDPEEMKEIKKRSHIILQNPELL